MYGRMCAGTGVTFSGLGEAMEGPETLELRVFTMSGSMAGVGQNSTRRAQDFKRCARGNHKSE